MNILIEIGEVNLNVEYSFDGEYYPATNEEPEEYPELYIEKVYVEDSSINIYWLLSEWQLEVITNKIWEDYKSN
jgi:hypothetical protein